MKKIFKRFQVKDFMFLAVLSSLMTLCGGNNDATVMHTTVFGPRNMAAATDCDSIAQSIHESKKAGAPHNYRTSFGALIFFFRRLYVF